MGTLVPLFFFLDPLFSAQLAPRWDGTQNDFLSHWQGKVRDEAAREIAALMAAFIVLFLRTRPNRALPAVFEPFVRQAAFAHDFFRRTSVHGAQPILEFLVVVPVRHEHPADSAIQSTWSEQFFVGHDNPPLC